MNKKRGGRVGNKNLLKYGGMVVLVAATFGVAGVALAGAKGDPGVVVAGAQSTLAAPSAPALTTVTAKRNSTANLRTLFAGDSLTGALFASVQTKGFKWLMLDSLEKTGPVEEFNSAISGGTTLDVSAKYEVPKSLDLAVVELGTNDLGKGTPLSDFAKAYGSLLDRISSGSPGVALVCAGVWEGGGGGPEGPTYDSIIMNQCAAHQGLFVSLRPIYRDPATIGPAGKPAFTGVADNFHPNDTGHQRIADALLARIKVS